MAEKDTKSSESSRDLIGFLQSTADELEALKKKQLAETEQSCQETIADAKDKAKAILKKAHEDAAAVIFHAEKDITEKREEIRKWTIEKECIAKMQKFPTRIKLDIGGVQFITSLTTLTRFPDTMIGVMFSGRHALELDDQGYFFIDRDGTYFRYILNFLRDPENYSKTDIPSSIRIELKKEVVYFGLQGEMFVPPHSPIILQCHYNRNTELTFTQDPHTLLWYIRSFCKIDRNKSTPSTVAICCRGCGEASIKTSSRWSDKPGEHGVGVRGFFNIERKINNPDQPQFEETTPRNLFEETWERRISCWSCKGQKRDIGEFSDFF